MFNHLIFSNSAPMKCLLILAITMITTLSVSSQNTDLQHKKTRFSLEIDPATFAFKGYSAHLRIQPKMSNHYLFGLGVYAMDMPSFFVDLNDKNKDKGWEVRINQGYGLFGEYHFAQVNHKWFVGSQISLQEYKIEQAGLNKDSKYQNFLLMGYGGYTLQPFTLPIYFKAWGGLGYTSKVSGDNILGEQEYEISPISMFATLHMGYTF